MINKGKTVPPHIPPPPDTPRPARATAVLLRGPASDGFENLADVVVDGLDELLDVVFPASAKPTPSGRKTP